MIPVYTAQVTTRHDEVDWFGRLQPGVYLRYLAHAAVEASTAAGFGPDWYAAAGTAWLVRRSTLRVHEPVRGGERLSIRTWVEDFRRVRSHRRYEARGTADRVCVEARTDWVYVEAATGRPRRVPREVEGAFGDAPRIGRERDPWAAPSPPAAPARSAHRVRLNEVDAFGHVNNAVYLDLVVQATHDALAEREWPLDRMLAAGSMPVLAAADLEYLSGARYGDAIEILTWFAGAPDALEAHHVVVPAGEPSRPLLHATTGWTWRDAVRDVCAPAPGDLFAALRPLLAA